MSEKPKPTADELLAAAKAFDQPISDDVSSFVERVMRESFEKAMNDEDEDEA